ncbi:MAG: cupin domain-containing protein [Chloroflexi bacterium]|nr:cupin domain-containing protein [Chloroflexota bacterium]
MQLEWLDSPSFVDLAKLPAIESPRGSLALPIDDVEIALVRNLHTVTVTPGAVRGNHRHPARTETVCVLAGEFVATFESADRSERFAINVEDGSRFRFVIRPGVAHAFRNVGPSLGMLLCFADRPFDPADIVTALMDTDATGSAPPTLGPAQDDRGPHESPVRHG